MISVVELFAVLTTSLTLAIGCTRVIQRWAMPGRVLTAGRHHERRAAWGETTKAHFHYVRRRTRYLVNCPMTYRVDGQQGAGLVVDMSREGWRIHGQSPVQVGGVISLVVCLPGQAVPVSIAQAVVRWSDGEDYGVSLLTLDPGPASQLSDYFSTLTAVPASLPARAA